MPAVRGAMGKAELLGPSGYAGDTAGDAAMPPLSAASASLIAALYRDHATPLRHYVLRRFGAGPPEPEEVAQVAFARLAQREDLASLRDPRGFLYTIACNFVIDHRRRGAHRGEVHGDLARVDAVAVSDPTPERVLLGKERLAILEQALQRMPAMRRRIFLMVRVEGQPPGEVARAFGLSDNAVHKHVSRALADCAAAFAARDADENER